MKRTAKRFQLLSLSAAALVGVLGATAAAQEPERPRDQQDLGERAFGNVVAPNARLAALIDAGGRPVRTKGVQSITRIDEGVYCIRPTPESGVDPQNSIVTLTPEYFYSQLDEIKVQWAAKNTGCSQERIAVYTFQDADRDGNYVFSNRVGFSIVVP